MLTLVYVSVLGQGKMKGDDSHVKFIKSQRFVLAEALIKLRGEDYGKNKNSVEMDPALELVQVADSGRIPTFPRYMRVNFLKTNKVTVLELLAKNGFVQLTSEECNAIFNSRSLSKVCNLYLHFFILDW